MADDGNTINLPPDLAARIEDRVASGAAYDAVDVVRAGLAALEAEDARKLAAIRAKLKRSIDDPRPSVPGEEAFARVLAELESKDRQ